MPAPAEHRPRPLAWSHNICTRSLARIDGRWTSASNDFATAEGESLIDAAFLASLPVYSRAVIEPVLPHESQLRIKGRVHSVIGALRHAQIAVYFDAKDEGNAQHLQELDVDVLYVVQSLPVPLHVSTKSATSRGRMSYDDDTSNHFEAAAFGPPYATHPYWTNATIMLPDHAHARPTVQGVAVGPPEPVVAPETQPTHMSLFSRAVIVALLGVIVAAWMLSGR